MVAFRSAKSNCFPGSAATLSPSGRRAAAVSVLAGTDSITGWQQVALTPGQAEAMLSNDGLAGRLGSCGALLLRAGDSDGAGQPAEVGQTRFPDLVPSAANGR